MVQRFTSGSGGTRTRRRTARAALCALALLAVPAGRARAADGTIDAIGIENEYADVIRQVGGRFVHAGAIVADPNTDPHTFEASPKIARALSGAELVVKNGLGYDSWADKILAAASRPNRRVIDVQHLLGLPDDAPNPHLWYDPKTMPAVADAIAAELGALRPAHAAEFKANARAFVASLKPWLDAVAAFKAAHPDTPVAVTEPVGDYLLKAMGADIKTPYSLEAALMNGTDPSPQDVSAQNALLQGKQVRVFVYNQQVTDALTQSFLEAAKRSHVPVVGVYETMPTPGFTYQSWMLAEVEALQKAVATGASTEVLAAKR